MSPVKKITLKSSDGVSFEVDEAVANHMMIGDDCAADSEIPLPNVKSKILAKVIEYCKKHVDSSAKPEELKAWDAEFVTVDQTTLFDLLLSADHLKIGGLTDLTAKAIVDLIKGKTPEQIRETFNLEASRCSMSGRGFRPGDHRDF